MNAITAKGRLLADEERLAPQHTALVLIDIQNDFCDARGVFGTLGHDLSMMPAMAANTRTLLEAARRRGILVLFVRATYDDEVLSAPLAETYHRRDFLESQCLEGSFGADWYAGLAPEPDAPNEVVVTKHRFSAFFGSDIDLVLRANDIRSLVFCGVVTSGCVESTLRDAFFRDYYVVCARDCVTEASPERHRASLHKIEQALGTVRDAAQIAAVWDRSHASAPERTVTAKRARARHDLRQRLDPKHSALVLVDLQRDHCDPQGACARSGEDIAPMQAALTNAQRLLEHARAIAMRVIHVRSERADAYVSEAGSIAPGAGGEPSFCRAGTPGAQLMPAVAPRAGEWIVIKRRSSGFVDTRLGLLLRSNGLRTLLVCGVPTQDGVESTVRDAVMRDYYVVVARDAVGAPGSIMHLHSAALETMARHFAECRPMAEIIAASGPRVPR